MTSEKEEKRRASWGSSRASTPGGSQNWGLGGVVGEGAPQSPLGLMLEELGLGLGWDQQLLLVRFLLYGDGEALRELFSGLDEVTRCLVIKYLLMETPMTKTDIARALGRGSHTELVDKILKRCQDGGNDSNNPTTAMPEITMTVREIEEVVRECTTGNCGRVKEMIRMAKGLFVVVGVAVLLEGRGLPRYRISQVMAIDGHRLKHLMELNEVLEFRLVSEFKLKTAFDAYWMYTSLVNLRLPFIIKSKFDPPNDVCEVFKDERLCHMFIAGYLVAEATKSTEYTRFRQVGTTHPVTVALLPSIASHLAEHGIMTKVRIDEKMNEVYFEFNGLPNDVKRFAEDVWEDPVALTKLSDGEFLAFLSGLVAGDGYIVWSRGDVEVALTGNLEKEKLLYAVIQGELRRRLGVEAFLKEYYSGNSIRLGTKNNGAVKLLQILPPLIEPLKELRRQVLLRRGVIGVSTAKKIFELLGDEKRNGEKGIYGLQSYQAIRFLTILTRLGLIKLKPEKKHYILKTPTNPHGWGLEIVKITNGGPGGI